MPFGTQALSVFRPPGRRQEPRAATGTIGAVHSGAPTISRQPVLFMNATGAGAQMPVDARRAPAPGAQAYLGGMSSTRGKPNAADAGSSACAAKCS